MRLRALFAFLALALAPAIAPAQILPRGDTVTGPCGRECLVAIADNYLAAMVAKDPNRIEWATRARYTENGMALRIGDALWATASGLSDYRQYFVDPAAGQIGFMGVVFENGNPVILGMRLKIVNHRILEVEHIVSRNNEGAQSLLDGAGPDPLFTRPLAAEERAPREALIGAANFYFDGIEQSSGAIVPFADDCSRVENGMRTAPSASGATCAQQFDTGAFSYITECRDRRFEVVDEETGSVLAFVIFAHPGNIIRVQLPGQAPRDMHPAALKPFDTQLAEVFNVRGGQIRRIEAAINTAAYGISSGWER